MMKKYIQLVLIILSLPYLSLGQEIREIRGTIVDSSTGDVLPGATVQIKDTTNGTIADYEGNFTIQASPEDVLMFSFIGFQPKEISVGDKTTFNIKLEPEDSQYLWDGRNDNGVVVGTAVYLVAAHHPLERNKVSKIAVIHK